MARTDPQINIRVPAELKKELELLAIENGRSLNAEVVLRLENSIAAKKSNTQPPLSPHNLESYIQHVVGIMKSAKDWDEFQDKLNQKYPTNKK